MTKREHLLQKSLFSLNEDYPGLYIKSNFNPTLYKSSSLLFLKEMAIRSNINFIVRIGGCESIRDLIDCKIMGVSAIAAPLIESTFALKKFTQAFNKVFIDDKENTKSWFSIESKTGLGLAPHLVSIINDNNFDTIIIDRKLIQASDPFLFTNIECPSLTNSILAFIEHFQKLNISFVLKGNITAQTYPLLTKIAQKTNILYIDNNGVGCRFTSSNTNSFNELLSRINLLEQNLFTQIDSSTDKIAEKKVETDCVIING